VSRNRDLLELAAAALEDGRSPFDRSFLVEHEVTIDEVSDLADSVAAGIRYLLAMTDLALPPRWTPRPTVSGERG